MEGTAFVGATRFVPAGKSGLGPEEIRRRKGCWRLDGEEQMHSSDVGKANDRGDGATPGGQSHRGMCSGQFKLAQVSGIT